MDATTIRRHIGDEPPDLGNLIELASGEGHSFVLRTRVEWLDGTNRFDRPGEGFFLATAQGIVVGMGGLNVDPFLSDPTVGRLRHLFVAPEQRRLGIGRSLVQVCLDHVAGHFVRVRLRTFDPRASSFYRSVGFDSVDEDAATHTIAL
ncbi:MAG: GNAT family N-acetyltransferase [Halobacteriales archaeon]|nr:GNAT family N-acetyltransferase [Halobacteriales archaeon]